MTAERMPRMNILEAPARSLPLPLRALPLPSKHVAHALKEEARLTDLVEKGG